MAAGGLYILRTRQGIKRYFHIYVKTLKDRKISYIVSVYIVYIVFQTSEMLTIAEQKRGEKNRVY